MLAILNDHFPGYLKRYQMSPLIIQWFLKKSVLWQVLFKFILNSDRKSCLLYLNYVLVRPMCSIDVLKKNCNAL